MKKFLSAVLAAMMVCSLSVGTLAQTPSVFFSQFGTEITIDGEQTFMVKDRDAFLAAVEANNKRADSKLRAAHKHTLQEDWIGFEDPCNDGSGKKHVLQIKYKSCVGPNSCGKIFQTAYTRIVQCPSKPKCKS